MNTILSSASKLAFLILVVTACVAFGYSVYVGKTVLESKDFMVLLMAAASFYFAYKGSDSSGTGTTPPFAGK